MNGKMIMKNILYIFNETKDKFFNYSYQIIGYLQAKNVNIYTDNKNLLSLGVVKLISEEGLSKIDFASIFKKVSMLLGTSLPSQILSTHLINGVS